MSLRSPAVFLHGLLAATLGLLAAQPGAAAQPDQKTALYDYYRTGSADDAAPSSPPRTPSAVLMGGGQDVDHAFAWMIKRAGGGDFVVLRATGDGAYNPYIYAMGGVDSVETLVIKTPEGASDPFVLDRVAKAEAVFIAGGDQSDYVTMWKNTPLEALLKRMIKRHVPMGGTSAGLAVLGQFDFAALKGTLYSAAALANPYGNKETLERGFLTIPALHNTITDDHFVTRDRMGRLVSFVARNLQDGWVSVDDARGIAVDEHTALLVDDGVARFIGTGAAYFLRPTIAPTVCEPHAPLTIRNVSVQRLNGPGSFDLRSWSSPDGSTAAYDLSVEAGVLTSSQAGGSPY
jgi:cyanophycinase